MSVSILNHSSLKRKRKRKGKGGGGNIPLLFYLFDSRQKGYS
jgi:hypothetical protein